MANWVKAFAAKHDHLSWVSSTHMMEGENRCSWLVPASMCAFQTNKQTVELNQNEVNCSMRQYDLERKNIGQAKVCTDPSSVPGCGNPLKSLCFISL